MTTSLLLVEEFPEGNKKARKLLLEEFERIGIDSPDTVAIHTEQKPFGYKTTAGDLKESRARILERIKSLNPRFVVTVGATPLKALTRKAGITVVHGSQLKQKEGFTVIPIYDPGYCLRDPSKLPGLKADVARIGRALKGQNPIGKIAWSLVTPDTLEQFVREFEAADRFAFDLETSGLFPFDLKGFVRCVGFALPSHTWVLPLEMRESPWKGRHKSAQTILQLLEYLQRRDGKRGIAHNGKFDNHWLWTYYKTSFHISLDTMLAHHTLDENSEHDLKTLSRQYLDVEDYDISTKAKKGDDPSMSLHDFYEYNAKDCHYTLQLASIFDRDLKKELPLRRLFYRLVMPAARALGVIERDGLTIDLARMAQVEVDTRAERNRTEQRLNKLIGRKINWNSPPQVAQVLYDQLGLECTLKTDAGQPSTSEAAILDLKGTHPVVDLLIKYRELAKFLSTYIEGFREWMHEDKLYVSYKLHGTVTGRYSSRIHSIPRDGTIRNLVTAPPGWIFWQADVSQAELRIAGAASGDLELITCYRRGIDVHWRTLLFMIAAGTSGEYVTPAIETAFKLSGKKLSLPIALEWLEKVGHEKCIEIWDGWKEARKKAKAINFGFIYGMYPKKFVQTAKEKYGFEPTLAEAESLRAAYFQLYRGLLPWHERQKKLVRLNGHVRNLAGRLRRLPGINSSDRGLQMEAERQAINSPVQGVIGDYKAMALVEIHETIDRSICRVVGEHHDAILGIVKIGHEDDCLPQVLRIMRGPSLLQTFKIELPIPMESDLDLGPWGQRGNRKYVENKRP